MYKSIEQIKKLREKKHDILKKVYQSNNPDDVYNNQRALGEMSINIFSDVANSIMPTLQEDGVSNDVWSNVSLKLNKLSFIGVPTAAEIREKYKQGVTNPTVVRVNGAQPKPGTKTNVKKISPPVFLALLAAQGITVPRAIQEVYRDNRKKLDDWFDALEKIVTEEIEKALAKSEG